MTPRDLQALAAQLRRERQARLAEVDDAQADLRDMAEERESELEEAAQEDRLAGVLLRLDDRSRRAIAEIDEALRRIADGRYGICAECGEDIPVERLHALPTAERCVECAAKSEVRALADTPEPPSAHRDLERHEDE